MSDRGSLTTRRIFRKTSFDPNQWLDESGQWVLEKSYVGGPRGGVTVEWVVWEVTPTGLRRIASERRLRDIWGHIPDD